jgi:acyl-CoA thioester hydrolase
MITEHKIVKQVEFSHTDMAGIMHFSNFYRFMEAVEHDLFRTLGKSVVGDTDEQGSPLGWPRVQSSCRHTAPLKFEDSVELHLVVRELRNATFKYEVIFNKVINDTLMEVARGEVTTVYVEVDQASGKMKARPLPTWFTNVIGAVGENYMKKTKNV